MIVARRVHLLTWMWKVRRFGRASAWARLSPWVRPEIEISAMNTTPAAPGTVTEEGYFVHWRRNLIVCVFGSFTTIVAMTLLLPFLPLYVEQLGVTDHAAIVQWSGVAYGATFFCRRTGRAALGPARRPLRAQADAGPRQPRHGRSDVADRHGAERLSTGGAAAAGRVARRLFLRLRRAGGDADAEGALGLGAGRAVGRHHGGQSGRAAARRRAAAADRHPRLPSWPPAR